MTPGPRFQIGWWRRAWRRIEGQRGLRRWMVNGVWVLVTVTAYAGIRTYQQATLAEGRAPEIHGTRLDGQAFDLTGLRGQTILVYFWATWCAVCRLEQGAIDSLQKHVPVIGIALRSGSAREVNAYLTKNRVLVPVVNDPDGSIAASWGVRATPTGFVIGPDGQIRFREVGWTSEWGWRWRMWWAARG